MNVRYMVIYSIIQTYIWLEVYLVVSTNLHKHQYYEKTTKKTLLIACAIVSEPFTYMLHSYTVNGRQAYSFNGTSISGDGYTMSEITDNEQLVKAIYFSYGVSGYAGSYEEIFKSGRKYRLYP